MNAEMRNDELQTTRQPAAESRAGESSKPRSAGGVYAPRVDILETDDELLLSADLPGVRPDDVSLSCKGDALELHARCAPRQDGKRPVHTEYGVGDFYRVFRVAEQIEPGGIEASLTAGVLTVRVPKAEAVRPKRISVRGG